MTIPYRHAALRLLALVIPLLLAACAGGTPEPASYPPLHYSYLPTLPLNVASIDVQDSLPPPPPGDIADRSPETPAAALVQMAHDRLAAQGVTGQAVFAVDQASIVRGPDGTLDGALKVHLEILGADGARLGYAEANVTRQSSTTDASLPLRSRLYDLTKRMVGDMNVEFEYQLRRSLSAWLVSGTAPIAPVVQQQVLPSPGADEAGSGLAPATTAQVPAAEPGTVVPGIAAPAGAAPAYAPGAAAPAVPQAGYTPPTYTPPGEASQGYVPPALPASGAPGYTPLRFAPTTGGPATTAAPGFSSYTPPSYAAPAYLPVTPPGMSPQPGYLGQPAGTRPPG